MIKVQNDGGSSMKSEEKNDEPLGEACLALESKVQLGKLRLDWQKLRLEQEQFRHKAAVELRELDLKERVAIAEIELKRFEANAKCAAESRQFKMQMIDAALGTAILAKGFEGKMKHEDFMADMENGLKFVNREVLLASEHQEASDVQVP
jgi:hypothetical protein